MQEAVAIADEFLESMVLEVDVLHSAMENWVLGDSDTCLIVFIEFDGSFVVIEPLWQLWSGYVLGDQKSIDASTGDVGEFTY